MARVYLHIYQWQQLLKTSSKMSKYQKMADCEKGEMYDDMYESTRKRKPSKLRELSLCCVIFTAVTSIAKYSGFDLETSVEMGIVSDVIFAAIQCARSCC